MALTQYIITRKSAVEQMSEEKVAALTLGITFFTVKFVTSIMIFGFFPSWYTVMILVATGFLWFMPIVYLAAHYLQISFRLRSVRRRRDELIAQEWRVD